MSDQNENKNKGKQTKKKHTHTHDNGKLIMWHDRRHGSARPVAPPRLKLQGFGRKFALGSSGMDKAFATKQEILEMGSHFESAFAAETHSVYKCVQLVFGQEFFKIGL